MKVDVSIVRTVAGVDVNKLSLSVLIHKLILLKTVGLSSPAVFALCFIFIVI